MYSCSPSSPYSGLTRIVAKLTGFEHEFVHVKEAEKEEYKANVNPRGVFPYLVTPEGPLGESIAISRFICNTNPESGLYGTNVKEQASIDEVIERQLSISASTGSAIYGGLLGYAEIDEEVFKDSMKKYKDYLRTLDEQIKDREFFVGDKLTLADVYIVSQLNIPFAVAIDSGFRKVVPNLTAWYEKVRNNDVIVSILGKPRFCGKQANPFKK